MSSKTKVRKLFNYYMKTTKDKDASIILATEPKWVRKEFTDVRTLYSKKLGSKAKGKAKAINHIKGKFGRT